MKRRTFLKSMAATGVAASMAGTVIPREAEAAKKHNPQNVLCPRSLRFPDNASHWPPLEKHQNQNGTCDQDVRASFNRFRDDFCPFILETRPGHYGMLNTK